MSIDVETIIVLLIVIVFIDLALIVRMIISKLKRDIEQDTKIELEKNLVSKWNSNENFVKFGSLSDEIGIIKRSIDVDVSSWNEKNAEQVNKSVNKDILRLKSRSKQKRIKAAVNLAVIGTDEATRAVEGVLLKEKDTSVKLYMANALSDISRESSIPVLIASLIDEKKWYREKVNILIIGFGSKIFDFIPDLIGRKEIEIIDFLVDCALQYPNNMLKASLFEIIDELDDLKIQYVRNVMCSRSCKNCKWGVIAGQLGNEKCKYRKTVADDASCRKHTKLAASTTTSFYDSVLEKAAQAAVKFYFKEIAVEKYLQTDNVMVRRSSIEALGKVNAEASVHRLKKCLEDDDTTSAVLASISKLVDKNASFIYILADYLQNEENEDIRKKLADALSSKIEFFIMKLAHTDSERAEEVIREVLFLGKTSEFIGFVNNNKNIDTENRLVDIIKQVIDVDADLKAEFCTYLNDRVLNKVKLKRKVKEVKVKVKKRGKGLTASLYVILIFAILLFPVIYAFRYYPMLGIWPWMKQMKTYVVDFNYYLVFYSLLINISYLILLVLSRINVSIQAERWQLKNTKMLFKKKMLPAVSIIAPAYNEDMTIIESVNSLLNLKYPDYDLVIVNDGSKDNTLHTLIEYFDLKRIDYSFDAVLNFEPVRGIYANRAFPKLLVVDKENGGKADSLNAGIAISRKEYFCCIDSDSLLEDESLLKLASQTLDESIETPAMGGNVFPINGCTVSRGYISKKRIPKNAVARFQTIEYIRAFMAGRLGWAYINSLLIISGAFGLFRKERVVDVGGYLTGKGRFNTDTVGEDMELVVRITHQMHKKKQRYKVNYCFNANCWTEVPEQLGQLKKQRYRWYRGLIETLHFHRETLFNPRFGRMGVLATPYFFVFELVGPLIEIQGYLMIVAALFLGILSAEIALLLFFSSIMLGVLVSIVSLIIAEKESSYYSIKDIMVLVGIAIIENFGPRQLFSLWRVIGYFKMFAKPTGWGELKRKGFSAN